MTSRTIARLLSPQATSDGAGVTLRRYFPCPAQDHIDPFLLFDHFGSDSPDDFIAGFPMHPHRGIETVTYLLAGRVKHRDSTGRTGTLEAGDVQWMSAGRGIMHEEMPEVADGQLDGFQFWLNLPAAQKMKPAGYQEYRAEQIPRFHHQNHEVRLIAGELFDQTGVVNAIALKPLVAELRMQPGELHLPIDDGHNAFIYVFEGAINVLGDTQAQTVTAPEIAVLNQQGALHLKADAPARVMLATGQPTNEPIVRGGPFVMNTREQVLQTWEELRRGTFPPD